MKKYYYIPTSSLNFNNILSTESVSPRAFYSQRGFGYSRWESVKENNFDGVTLLYSTPHMFTRPASELEDHAMLIEVETDEEFPELSEGIFYTDKTIYLNPWQTKFYFFTQQVLTTVRSLSDSSLETKMCRLYKSGMQVATFEGEYPKALNVAELRVGDTAAYIEEDYAVNKMKGLLYGYYIGANLSASQSLVVRLDSLRRIQDIFASIRSSESKTASSSQEEQLKELFSQLERAEPIYWELEQEFPGLSERIVAFLTSRDRWVRVFDREKHVRELKTEGENNPAVGWVQNEIRKVEQEIQGARVRLDPEKAEIIVSTKDKLSSLKSLDNSLMSSLMTHWVNETLYSRDFDGKVSPQRNSLATEITKAAKNIMGETWEDSQERVYLNQLRRHLGGDAFEQPWDNGLLSSVAAVLIKGDDWESLLHFMQSKGMYDYRLAFAVYGLLNGFANMTRDFTDILLNEESSYLSRVYKEFYGQLHDKRIEKGNYAKVDSHPEIVEPLVERAPRQDSDEFERWAGDIKSIGEKCIKGAKDKKELSKTLEEALSKCEGDRDISKFFELLLSYPVWKTKGGEPRKGYKDFKQVYFPQESEAHQDLFIKESSEPLPASQGLILRDSHRWIEECARLITDEEAKSQFKVDARWFVDNHEEVYYDKKKGVIKGFYHKKDRSNTSVRDRLEKYLWNKRESKEQWLAKIYKSIPIDKIMAKIAELYGV
ncbi:MAG: hypothetical protein SPK09_08930 [Porphyromonas sp.]|nr:hypothetical protein [Porphyromonas sp.]